MIEKNCWAGLEEYSNSLIKALTLECEEGNGSGGIKRKTRKRRRATGVGAALQTHASEHISANHQISPSNLPHAHSNIMRYFTYMLVMLLIVNSIYVFSFVQLLILEAIPT